MLKIERMRTKNTHINNKIEENEHEKEFSSLARGAEEKKKANFHVSSSSSQSIPYTFKSVFYGLPLTFEAL